MSAKDVYQLTNIQEIKEIELNKKLVIIDKVINILQSKFKSLNLEYIKSKLLETSIFIADVPKEYFGVVYLHETSSIYIDKNIDILKFSEEVLHEFIHAIQTIKDNKDNTKKIGLCEFGDFKATGMGINEAAVQYITSKISNSNQSYVNKYDVLAKTYKEDRYPLACNIIMQLVYLLGEDKLVNAVFNGDDNFEYEIMEKCGEGVYVSIINGLDKMIYAEEEIVQYIDKIETLKNISDSNTQYEELEKEVYPYITKIDENRALIKNTYFKIEDLILTSYFDKYFNRIEDVDDVEKYREDLYNFKDLYGESEDYNSFNDYYINKMEELEDKRLSIMRKTNKLALAKTDNRIVSIFTKIRAVLLKLFGKKYTGKQNN